MDMSNVSVWCELKGVSTRGGKQNANKLKSVFEPQVTNPSKFLEFDRHRANHIFIVEGHISIPLAPDREVANNENA